MAKLKLNHYLGVLVALYFFLVLVIFLLSASISKETLALAGSLLALILFYLSHVFADRMIDYSEAMKDESERELSLKTNDAQFHVGLGVGVGLAMLLAGIVGENKDYLLVSFGLTILLIANVTYNWAYLPRQYQLTRLAAIEKMQPVTRR